MRRLPIYFLIDVSESMVGEPIEQVQNGIATIIKELRTDPYALETVYISIIVFAGKAKEIVHLTELYNFYPPKIPIGGGTSIGTALNFLMDNLDRSIKKTTLDEKGDWKPIIFLFTDGNPTDRYEYSFDRWNNKYRNSTNLVAVTLGQGTDTNILKRITDNVLQLKNTDSESFKAFFKWITASIKTSSISVSEMHTDDLKLAPIDEDFLNKIEQEMNQQIIDDNYAVMLGKCQNTHRPYLMKYRSNKGSGSYSEYNINKSYNLVGAYPIDETYFELSDIYQTGQTVNTAELTGFPTCPCCGNQYGFSVCKCRNIMCVGNEEMSKCPWCNSEAQFGFAEGDSDIGRTRG
ncbi:VWA domain-containing protein [Dysgonomonas sp. Marseille-P4677]|uniref:TerY-C metal binding domain-containing protein n=1 Tax=Dysgonomonas sp. Marseille-P4677 TaxID=2364790 RepID=UPI00191144E6|nr:TerY-C metal binding domain-containing protein [Dysgonomonas sp. Marseille-P4677]MBK5720881.1 VWA domain-containing protein [Dysgonomonas sp. Marseille-P4677]